MRILLVLALFAAACGGSKKPATSPSPATESKESESDLRDANKPDDADDERSKSADDPCDGGE